MKVLFKLNDNIETIDNVSVDDKCFPLVAGVHPYVPSARTTSPLALESSLWFKTLAVEAVYIDCNRRVIYWLPVLNDVDPAVVVLRRSVSNSSVTGDFIPSTAQPLFEDSSLYDFNPSLKEMMGKCCETMRKFSKRSISTEEFNKVVAQILHVCILPNISFSADDIYCLSRTRALIEERLNRAEDNIADKADSIEKLRKCLDTLKTNLLSRENMDSERYLRTCRKEFLKPFLKTMESDIETLNLELETQQRKVNWARQQGETPEKIREFQDKRDLLYKEVEKLIRVREAIKNVILRREKTKRKMKKSQIVESCFHNVFIEIIRRMDVEYQTLNSLGNDKVNICAAREATMSAILEIDNNNRNSDRTTKFETLDTGDFTVGDENNVDKSEVWLTFQERVSRLLYDTSTAASKVHKEGCKRLISFINLALSEFSLTYKGGKREALNFSAIEDSQSHFSLSLDEVKMGNRRGSQPETDMSGKSTSLNRREDSAALLMTVASAAMGDKVELPRPHSQAAPKLRHSNSFNTGDRKPRTTSDIQLEMSEPGSNDDYIVVEHIHSADGDHADGTSNLKQSDNDEESDNIVELRHRNRPLNRQRQVMNEQLAMSTLMKSVDNLKAQIQNHFRDVIDSLVQEQTKRGSVENNEQEQRELLWKSYEQSFCQELLPQLIQLYNAGLSAGAKKAHETLTGTPLNEILQDDMLLDLFFGTRGSGSARRTGAMTIPDSRSKDKISMAKTLSCLSVDVRNCAINDLYDLANADSVDMRRRLNLDDGDESDDNEVALSSSGSEGIVSGDEGACDLSSGSSAGVARSLPRNINSVDRHCQEGGEEEHVDRTSLSSSAGETGDNWKCFPSPSEVEQILDPILSPFRRMIRKCLDAHCFLDKVRYITKATEDLNRNISHMIGPDFHAACDDLLSMHILALANMSEDVFVGLYVNVRLLSDVLPNFLQGTLWDYNLVSLYASYDFLFTRKVCENVVKRYPGSFKVKGVR